MGLAMASAKVKEDGYISKFDPREALRLVQTCVLDNGDVSLPIYVNAQEHIFHLATIFATETRNVDEVISAVKERLTILQELCSGESKEHYSTVQSMVDYEIQHQLVDRQDKPSGTVTLIRYLRVMESICAALSKVSDNTIPDDMLPSAMVDAYTQNLGRYHPQLMVITMETAILQLVITRETVLAAISGIPQAERVQWLLSMEQYMRKSLGSIQKVYADRRLLNLPQGSW